MQKAAAILAISFALAVPAHAQTYPNKPVRLISAFSPGGGSEIGLRLLGQKLMEGGWPSVIVENRPGGGGVVAAEATRQSAPDGYTLLQADAGAFAINVTLIPDLPYDPLKDFTPITVTWNFPSVLVVPVGSTAKTGADLLALARTKPGGLIYASSGVGSGGQLLGTMLANSLGVAMTHAPYKGASAAMPDVVAGRVDFIYASYGSVKQYVEAGNARVLAVTSKARLAELPDVPTMTELGQPSVFLDIWFGIVGPARMPPEVVAIVHDKIVQILHTPEMTKRLAEMGLYVVTSSPDEYRQMIASDISRLRKVVNDAGIRPQ